MCEAIKCPFCDSEGVYEFTHFADYSESYIVGCKNEDCIAHQMYIGHEYYDAQEALLKWNTRKDK